MASLEEMQKLKYITDQKLNLQEQNYYVYEDMMNVLSIATQLDEFEKYIDALPGLQNQTEQLRKVQRNRLILQINLSNTIHADLKFTSQKDGLENDLKSAKSDCNKFASNYSKKTFQNPFIKEMLEHYFNNNLSQGNYINQLNLLPTEKQADFNEKTAQKVFSGMIQQDNAIVEINKNGYKPPSQQNMQQRLQQIRRETAEKVARIEVEEQQPGCFDCCTLI